MKKLPNPLSEPGPRIEVPLRVEIGLRGFIGLTLPTIACDRPLAVSAMSYRPITGFSGGEVPVLARGVRAVAIPGSYRLNPWTRASAALLNCQMGLAELGLFLASQRDEVAAEMSAVAMAAEMQLAGAEGTPLSILYAGFHGFETCVLSAERLVAKRPDAILTVVTCRCCLPAKRARLEPLVNSGALRALVVVESCGGEDEMGEIVSAVARLP